MKKILIATHNPGKLALYQHYLKDLPLELVSLQDVGITFDVPETGTTFEQNACLKAESYAQLSGLLTLADDGGLEVQALHGQPGVYSARYAGEQATDAYKVQFLLDKMQGIPDDKRAAQFVVVLALKHPRKEIQIFKGTMKGYIAREARGQCQKGLPYRQIFIPEGFDKTLDELDELGLRSYPDHRKKAIDALKTELLK